MRALTPVDVDGLADDLGAHLYRWCGRHGRFRPWVAQTDRQTHQRAQTRKGHSARGQYRCASHRAPQSGPSTVASRLPAATQAGVKSRQRFPPGSQCEAPVAARFLAGSRQSSRWEVESLLVLSPPERRTIGGTDSMGGPAGTEDTGGPLDLVLGSSDRGGALLGEAGGDEAARLGAGEDCVLLGEFVFDAGVVADPVPTCPVGAAGANSRRPAVSGSEAKPMRWLTSWLVPQVIAAASAIPSVAASATSRLRRSGLIGRSTRTRERPWRLRRCD